MGLMNSKDRWTHPRRARISEALLLQKVTKNDLTTRVEETLLKKTPSERKGIASVTAFGRQKTFYLEMYHLHLFYHLFK